MLPLPSVSRSAASTSSSSAATSSITCARLLRRHDDGVADAVRAADGEGAHAVRAGVGVGGVDDDVVVRHAERLGARSARMTVFRPWPRSTLDSVTTKLPVGGGMDERLGRIAAEVHAGRVVDRGDAASAQHRHAQASSRQRRHRRELVGDRPVRRARPPPACTSISAAPSAILRCAFMSPSR